MLNDSTSAVSAARAIATSVSVKDDDSGAGVCSELRNFLGSHRWKIHAGASPSK
jgi:hypothetical protein